MYWVVVRIIAGAIARRVKTSDKHDDLRPTAVFAPKPRMVRTSLPPLPKPRCETSFLVQVPEYRPNVARGATFGPRVR